MLFGTKKLRNIGGDLGSAVKGFKKAISDEDKKSETESKDADFNAKSIDEKNATAQKSQVKDKEQA